MQAETMEMTMAAAEVPPVPAEVEATMEAVPAASTVGVMIDDDRPEEARTMPGTMVLAAAEMMVAVEPLPPVQPPAQPALLQPPAQPPPPP
jgi:hypothetical protein